MNKKVEETSPTNSLEVQLALGLQSFLNDFCKNLGIQYLIDKIEELIKHPVVLHDMGYKILAKSYDAEDIVSLVSNDNETFFLNDQIIDEISFSHVSRDAHYRKSPIYYKKTEPLHGTMVSAIDINNVQVAQLAVYESGIEFKELDFLLIEKISQLLSIELQKDSTFNITRRIIPNYILNDLLLGKQMDESFIRQKLHYTEWGRESSFRILILSDSIHGSLETKAASIAPNLNYYIPLSNCITFDSNIVVFLTTSIYSSLFQHKTDTFYDFLETYELRAGISMEFHELSDCKRFYTQALQALDVARQKNTELASFDSVRLAALSNIIKKNYSLLDFIHPAIIFLDQHDQEHHQDLIATLEAYLEYTNNPNDAADHLNIHRNTLFYRINKIKELTDVTLENGFERGHLLFSIYLLTDNTIGL